MLTMKQKRGTVSFFLHRGEKKMDRQGWFHSVVSMVTGNPEMTELFFFFVEKPQFLHEASITVFLKVSFFFRGSSLTCFCFRPHSNKLWNWTSPIEGFSFKHWYFSYPRNCGSNEILIFMEYMQWHLCRSVHFQEVKDSYTEASSTWNGFWQPCFLNLTNWRSMKCRMKVGNSQTCLVFVTSIYHSQLIASYLTLELGVVITAGCEGMKFNFMNHLYDSATLEV